MKTQIIFLCVLGVIASVSCFPSLFDDQAPITEKEIADLRPGLECVLDQGPCDDLGNMAKKILPEVLQKGKCLSCSEDVNKRIQRTIEVLHKAFPPKVLRDLVRKYNPTGQSAFHGH